MSAHTQVLNGMKVWGLTYEGALERLRQMGEVNEETAGKLLAARAAQQRKPAAAS